MVAITPREHTPNLFGLQRLNRILDEAFAGLPFPKQGGNILTANWVPATLGEVPSHPPGRQRGSCAP